MIKQEDSPGLHRATSVTIFAFYAVAIFLSLLPLPDWARPTQLVGYITLSDANKTENQEKETQGYTRSLLTISGYQLNWHFASEDPVQEVVSVLFSKPESVPLPDQQADQQQAANDPLLEESLTSEDPQKEIAVAPKKRKGPVTQWEMPERKHFDTYAKRLGLGAAPLVRNCADFDPNGNCTELSMSRFYKALEAIENGKDKVVVRVVHFGDSLIASDKISDMVRRRMQERFGSAGRGFLMGKRFNQFQRGNRSGRAKGDWSLEVMTASLSSLKDRHFGFSGASFAAKNTNQSLVFKPLSGSGVLDLYYLASPKAKGFAVLADGELVEKVSTKYKKQVGRRKRVKLPEGAETLTIKSMDRLSRIYGINLEAKVSGITWSSLGLPGATSEVWLRPGRKEFVRLLRRFEPTLAVVMLGGNDGLMLSKKRTTIEAIEKDTRNFIKRIQASEPESDCLLVSPLEAVRAKAGGRQLIPKPEVLEVIKALQRVAKDQGCGFWDMHASMGGVGSLKKWIKANLMLADRIHPRSRGSDLLGEMMAEAIMRSYDARYKEAL